MATSTKNLPRTRQASYEQGWETGYAAAESATIDDLRPHLNVIIRELSQGWIPAEVLDSLKYIKRVVDE